MVLDQVRLALRAKGLHRPQELQSGLWLGMELLRRHILAIWENGKATALSNCTMYQPHDEVPEMKLAFAGSSYYDLEVDELAPTNANQGLLWFAVPKGRTTHTRKRIRNQNWRYYPFKPVAYECQLCGKVKDKHQFCKKCLTDPVASGMAIASRAPRPSLKSLIKAAKDSMPRERPKK